MDVQLIGVRGIEKNVRRDFVCFIPAIRKIILPFSTIVWGGTLHVFTKKLEREHGIRHLLSMFFYGENAIVRCLEWK